MKTNAKDTYTDLQILAAQTLKQITIKLENHAIVASATSVHWGHIGDLGKTVRDLQEILDFLGGN